MSCQELIARWSRAVSTAALSDAERREQARTALADASAALARDPLDPQLLTLTALLLRFLASLEPDAAAQLSLSDQAHVVQCTAQDRQNRATAGLS
jgi:hypothetical protein